MWPFYREFTCCVCGGKGIDRSTKQEAKYCSRKCRNTYRNHQRYGKKRGDQVCPHNEGVACDSHKCDGCGWNLAVWKHRKEALYEREAENAQRYP